eukprot:297223-Pleurochrysis_carterae.AAC.2
MRMTMCARLMATALRPSLHALLNGRAKMVWGLEMRGQTRAEARAVVVSRLRRRRFGLPVAAKDAAEQLARAAEHARRRVEARA